ncbi:MAG TPA: LysR family transcriptional regulator [Candidatus Limnocylindria bacterium]|nr:LysR family transcriptional regulator [Candidatus Limnocylindria bacterium]
MELNLHQLKIFLAVARDRSFSRAASRLRISQPSVSIQVRNLEESLKIRLFARVRHRVCLTADGAMVLKHAKKTLEAIDQLQCEIDKINGSPRERLLLGCSRVPSARLAPLAVARLKSRRPAAEISIKTGRSHEVEQWILENEVELGIIEGKPGDNAIAAEPACDDELLLILPPRSPLLKRKRLSLKDVAAEPFLLQAPGVRLPFIERIFGERSIDIRNRIVVGSREAVKTAIAAGCGVSLLPRSVVEVEIRAGVLKAKKVGDLDIKYPMSIIYRREKIMSPAARAFSDLVRAEGPQLVGRAYFRRRPSRVAV